MTFAEIPAGLRLFLDTSVLLAASGSPNGASREIFSRASANGWTLITTPYAIEETFSNLAKLPPQATAALDLEHDAFRRSDHALG